VGGRRSASSAKGEEAAEGVVPVSWPRGLEPLSLPEPALRSGDGRRMLVRSGQLPVTSVFVVHRTEDAAEWCFTPQLRVDRFPAQLACASSNAAMRLAGTRPRLDTVLPCDSAHARTSHGSGPTLPERLPRWRRAGALTRRALYVRRQEFSQPCCVRTGSVSRLASFEGHRMTRVASSTGFPVCCCGTAHCRRARAVPGADSLGVDIEPVELYGRPEVVGIAPFRAVAIGVAYAG
jgi:hypothetical protein